MIASPIERVVEIMEAPDRELDLAEAALLIAKEEYPGLDVERGLARIAAQAERVAHRLPSEVGVGDAVYALNEHLFADEGYTGESDPDPRNGFLNEVLDRRRGIPAVLAILYVSVGRCLGLPLQCVALPGYFLVKFPQAEGSLIIDPYKGGACLDELAVRATLARAYGEDVPEAYLPALLAPATKRDVVLRLLRSLKDSYVRAQRVDKALWFADYLLRIAPEQTHEIRERAHLYELLHHTQAAAADYRRYLELAPDAADGPEIRRRLRQLDHKSTYLH
jgi:regulator of sirC expression with transglutaminase-like and TPR domain